tara:strand:+ start:233 stop:391 length:159 start_codon:yes stop_codon:yes gene_type:complete
MPTVMENSAAQGLDLSDPPYSLDLKEQHFNKSEKSAFDILGGDLSERVRVKS